MFWSSWFINIHSFILVHCLFNKCHPILEEKHITLENKKHHQVSEDKKCHPILENKKHPILESKKHHLILETKKHPILENKKTSSNINWQTRTIQFWLIIVKYSEIFNSHPLSDESNNHLHLDENVRQINIQNEIWPYLMMHHLWHGKLLAKMHLASL